MRAQRDELQRQREALQRQLDLFEEQRRGLPPPDPRVPPPRGADPSHRPAHHARNGSESPQSRRAPPSIPSRNYSPSSSYPPDSLARGDLPPNRLPDRLLLASMAGLQLDVSRSDSSLETSAASTLDRVRGSASGSFEVGARVQDDASPPSQQQKGQPLANHRGATAATVVRRDCVPPNLISRTNESKLVQQLGQAG